ncbi:uncharacterized protein A4U43_C08F9040, partial [Asparagus officinalis]
PDRRPLTGRKARSPQSARRRSGGRNREIVSKSVAARTHCVLRALCRRSAGANGKLSPSGFSWAWFFSGATSSNRVLTTASPMSISVLGFWVNQARAALSPASWRVAEALDQSGFCTGPLQARAAHAVGGSWRQGSSCIADQTAID